MNLYGLRIPDPKYKKHLLTVGGDILLPTSGITMWSLLVASLL
ncbi:MAG: hypothetical protein ACFB15_17240 [Cyclobacteriaceae bacterium]